MVRQDGVRFFIPGLPDFVTDEELAQHFGQYGRILEAVVAKERDTNVSRGFGYVTMEDGTNPDALLNDVHSIGGKDIRIVMTKESLTGTGAKKVYLNNCELLSADEIRDAMAEFGQIWDVHTPKDPNSGERRRFAFVTYGTDDAYQRAVSAGSVFYGGARITIKPASQNELGDGMGKGADAWDGWGKGSGGKGFDGGMGGGCGGAWGGGGKGGGCWGSDGGFGWGQSGSGDSMGCGGKGSGASQASGEGLTYFVSNLPDGWSEQDLLEYFSRWGKVLNASVARDKGGDKSRGFAYVTMQDPMSRDMILSDRHDVGGTQLSVMLSKENLIGTEVLKVHIDNCERFSPEQLRDAFSTFGLVLDVHTPKDPMTGERRRFAFVTFGTEEALQAAVSQGSVAVGDETVRVKLASRSQSTVMPLGGGFSDKGKGKDCGKGFCNGGSLYGGCGWGGWPDQWGYKGCGGKGPDMWGGKGVGMWGMGGWGGKGYGMDWYGKGCGDDWAWGGKKGGKDKGKGDFFGAAGSWPWDQKGCKGGGQGMGMEGGSGACMWGKGGKDQSMWGGVSAYGDCGGCSNCGCGSWGGGRGGGEGSGYGPQCGGKGGPRALPY